MTTVKGRVAVVTGAASGIGRALALELAARGARGLAIADVDGAGLEETARLVPRGVAVHADVVDMTDRARVSRYAADVATHLGGVDQLYNNAGVAGDREVLDPDVYDALERIIEVNLWGVIHGSVEFLPHLLASGAGHLVNVSSLNGIAATPRQLGYCASKFAVRGFSEALQLDLLMERKPVRVSVVYPAGVRTEIATSALRDNGSPTTKEVQRARLYNERFLRMSPADAAIAIVDGVERNRPRIRVGRDARVADRVVRLLPGRYTQVLAPGSRKMFL